MVAASSIDIVLSPSRVVCGRFSSHRQRLVLRSYLTTSVTEEPGEPWPACAGRALADLVKREGRRLRMAVALPLTAVFHKHVGELPLEAGSRRRRLEQLAQEASCLAPAALAWAAQPAGTNREAILAVARGAEMAALHAQCEAAGAGPVRFLSAGFTLQRALSYNYPELARPAVLAAAESEGLHLLFVDGSRCQIRSLRWSSDDADETARTLLELKRALALHRHQGTQRAPELLLWANQHADDPAMAQTLSEALGLRVERFDPLRRVEIAPSVSVDADTVAQGKLVGLALVCRAREADALDLRPPQVKCAERRRNRRALEVALLVLVVAGLCLGAGFYRHRAAETSRALRVARAQLAIARADAQQREVDQARLAGLRSELAAVEHIAAARTGWAKLLAELERQLDATGEAWLDELHFEPGNTRAGVASAPRLVVTGCLLQQRGAPAATSSEVRAQSLIERLAQAPCIESVCDERFDEAEPGLLRFGCTLVLRGAP